MEGADAAEEGVAGDDAAPSLADGGQAARARVVDESRRRRMSSRRSSQTRSKKSEWSSSSMAGLSTATSPEMS